MRLYIRECSPVTRNSVSLDYTTLFPKLTYFLKEYACNRDVIMNLFENYKKRE